MSLDRFTTDELEIVKEIPNTYRQKSVILNTPITAKENFLRLYNKKTPMWIPFNEDGRVNLRVDVDPENSARSPSGGKDSYGVEWVWVEEVKGAMVRPGNPLKSEVSNTP